MSEFVSLSPLERYSDYGLLLLRLVVGTFLIYGVWDNIVSAERMREFVAFLGEFGFSIPDFMARLSVWAQFAIGLAFITGLLARWAGVLCAVNFIVAFVMVDRFADFRGAFPSLCLIAIGVYLALHGCGRFGLDTALQRTVAARPDPNAPC